VIGTASPGLGAKFLNVEDADELREQKKMLVWSGASMLLWGVSLLALALAAPDGPVPQAAALAVGGGRADVAASLAFADRWAPAAARSLRAGWAEVEADGVSPVGRLDADAIRAPLVPFVQEMHALGRR
jgi:hypothetical protein